MLATQETGSDLSEAPVDDMSWQGDEALHRMGECGGGGGGGRDKKVLIHV